MFQQLFGAASAIVLSVGVCIAFFYGANALLDYYASASGLDYRSRDRRERIRSILQPLIFVGPALLLLSIFLIYPVIKTVQYSFMDRGSFEWVGLANYVWAFHDEEFQQSIFNNILWLVIVPSASTFLGLLIAYLTDRIWWGQAARMLIFLPMAISFLAASVIWKFVYDFRGPDSEQIGLLNAIWVGLGGEPQAWIALPFWNNIFLMIILVWIQTGFAMVILGAAMRGVPEETLEAAHMEGANEMQIFFKIIIPQVLGTVLVVWTTITITVLKVFDIVYAMTNGQWDTEVIANMMFDTMFRAGDAGRGSAIAVVLMVAVLPIMWWNIRNVRKEEI